MACVKLSSARSFYGRNGIAQLLLEHMSRKETVVEEEEKNNSESLKPLRNLEWSSSVPRVEIQWTASTKNVEPLDHTSGCSGGDKLGTSCVQVFTKGSRESSLSDGLILQSGAFLAVDGFRNGSKNGSSNAELEASADCCHIQNSSFEDSC